MEKPNRIEKFQAVALAAEVFGNVFQLETVAPLIQEVEEAVVLSYYGIENMPPASAPSDLDFEKFEDEFQQKTHLFWKEIAPAALRELADHVEGVGDQMVKEDQ